MPPDILEIRVRLGFIPHDRHGRWQVEVLDPSTGELLAMHSMPHFDLHDVEQELGGVGARLGMLLEAFLNPDPF